MKLNIGKNFYDNLNYVIDDDLLLNLRNIGYSNDSIYIKDILYYFENYYKMKINIVKTIFDDNNNNIYKFLIINIEKNKIIFTSNDLEINVEEDSIIYYVEILKMSIQKIINIIENGRN